MNRKWQLVSPKSPVTPVSQESGTGSAAEQRDPRGDWPSFPYDYGAMRSKIALVHFYWQSIRQKLLL